MSVTRPYAEVSGVRTMMVLDHAQAFVLGGRCVTLINMRAGQTTLSLALSGTVYIAASGGCSLQDYDYLGAGPSDSKSDESSETSSSSETSETSSTSSTSEGSSDAGTAATSSSSVETSSVVDASLSSSGDAEAPSDTQSTVPMSTSSEVEGGAPSSSSSDVTSSEPLPPLVVEGNVLTNPNFENGLPPWLALGKATLQASPAAAHTGAKGAVCASRTQTWEGPSVNVLSLVEPGQQYVMSAWVRTTSKYGAEFHIARKAVCIFDGGIENDQEAAVYKPLVSTYAFPEEWTQIATAPFDPFAERNCDLNSFILYIEGPRAGETFHMDDVSLVPYTP